MFVYTKNRHVIKELQAEGCKLINKRADGVMVYALLPSSKFKFEKQKNTWLSNSLTF